MKHLAYAQLVLARVRPDIKVAGYRIGPHPALLVMRPAGGSPVPRVVGGCALVPIETYPRGPVRAIRHAILLVGGVPYHGVPETSLPPPILGAVWGIINGRWEQVPAGFTPKH